MTSFRILHLSDLHIVKYSLKEMLRRPRVGKIDIVEAIARFAWSNKKELDAILVTGDIADNGHAANMDLASRFIKDQADPPKTPFLSQRKHPTLAAAEVPVMLVPGNHDRFGNMLYPLGGETFDDYCFSHWNVGYGGVVGHELPNSVNPELAIVCVDFCLDSDNLKAHWGNKDIKKCADEYIKQFGQGDVYENRLEKLKEKTEEYNQRKIPVLWAIHFAPEFEKHDISFDNNLILRNSDRLLKLADELNINHIFCGHTHRSKCYKSILYPHINIYCAASAACDHSSDETSFFIQEVIFGNGKIQISSKEYKWQKEIGEFKV